MFTLDTDTPLHICHFGQENDSPFFYYIACKECIDGEWFEGKIRIQLPNHKYYSCLPLELKRRNLYLPKGTVIYPNVHNRTFESRLKPGVKVTGFHFPIASFEPLGEDVYFF